MVVALRLILSATGLAIAAVVMSGSNDDPAAESFRVVRGDSPIEICLEADAEAARGLASGKQRPVLAVLSYDPPADGRSVIEVSSSVTGVTSRIGLFPGGVFKADSPKDARRFFLPAAEGDLAAKECFTVDLSGGQGASAEVRLEISAPFKE